METRSWLIFLQSYSFAQRFRKAWDRELCYTTVSNSHWLLCSFLFFFHLFFFFNTFKTKQATDEFSTSAEEVAEKLTQSRFIHGIPFIQEGKSHGHVVFALSDLPPGINWFHPIHDVYILPHSDGKTFTINGKVYDSAVQSVDGKFDAELRNFSALKHGLVS